MQVLKTKSFEGFVIQAFKSRDFETLLVFKTRRCSPFYLNQTN